jgi:arylamine N-acetyltransferase
MRVPFENVSKLHRYRRDGFRGVPDLSEFLDGIEHFNLGGTCYPNNYSLHRLLHTLGYEVALCGADMTHPDVHLVNIVRVDGREHLVDGGYGSPFFAPLPRDLEHDHEIEFGRERYLLKPQDADGRSRLEFYRDGIHSHGYVVNPAPRVIEEFESVIQESFSASATFMNALVIVRFAPGRSVQLHNLTLTETEGPTVRSARIATAAELPGVIEERFGIPGAITRVALAGLQLSQDPWAAPG